MGIMNTELNGLSESVGQCNPVPAGAAEAEDTDLPMRILLIEDDVVVRMVGEKLLESLGFQVLTAANGRQGLAIHAEHQGRIRLVLLDMLMPVMGGAECFAALHARDPGLPIVFASGFSGDTDVEQMVNNGAAGWLQKPYKLNELARVIRTALSSTPR